MQGSSKELGFKELGNFGKYLQVREYQRYYSCKKMPHKRFPEVIVLGKSNVGKSSLINALLNYNISKISRTPGCTRWLGQITLEKLSLIDLPGYGFANVAKGRKAFWQEMVEEYSATNRPDFALILVDSRKGIQKEDIEVSNVFNCDHLFLFTKCDLNSDLKLFRKKEEQMSKNHSVVCGDEMCKGAINKSDVPIIPENVLPVSVKSGIGIVELRKLLVDFSNSGFSNTESDSI